MNPPSGFLRRTPTRRFRDRRDAGRVLADELASYRGRDRLLVLGLARGGVPVGWEVASALGAELDVFLVRKLGVPQWRELAIQQSETPRTETVLTAHASALNEGSGSNPPRGVQVIAAQPAASAAVHNAEFARGVAFAEERAEREARLQRPLYVMPTKGIFTSSFGYRWGVLHAGIDLANAIGTPIYAVSDGVVIDAGPTAGYGMWVKLLHADGTVTLYGHVNTTLVSVGERVMAGDQIATMGSRGFSTGPHLHFEVLLGGTERVDPVPWLAKRGLSVGNYTG